MGEAMIIDTNKLREKIQQAEEDQLQKLYDGDWEKCPVSFLNSSERRALKRIYLIEQVEFLVEQLQDVIIKE